MLHRQRSNVLADWAKNPDKPPILENPSESPDKGQKEDASGETHTPVPLRFLSTFTLKMMFDPQCATV